LQFITKSNNYAHSSCKIVDSVFVGCKNNLKRCKNNLKYIIMQVLRVKIENKISKIFNDEEL